MTETNVELGGYCPVAYFVADGPLMGSAEFSSTHNGKTYYLVSEEAKQAFDANPDNFMPAYDGLCAFGVTINEKFPVDPTNYKLVDGRLFLFLKNDDTDAKELWDKEDEAEMIAKADANFNAA